MEMVESNMTEMRDQNYPIDSFIMDYVSTFTFSLSHSFTRVNSTGCSTGNKRVPAVRLIHGKMVTLGQGLHSAHPPLAATAASAGQRGGFRD